MTPTGHELKFTPTTEARYREMLEVLPPAVWTGLGFLVGEPHDHNAEGQPRFACFVQRGDKFFEVSRALTVAEFRAIRLMDLPS